MSEIPSKWCAIVVLYGEGRKHLYANDDMKPTFFATEDEAQKWAEDVCRFNQRAQVLVLKSDRIIKARPVEFETVSVDADPVREIRT